MNAITERPKSLYDLVKEFLDLKDGANKLWLGRHEASDAYWAGRKDAYGACAHLLSNRLNEIRLWELEHPES